MAVLRRGTPLAIRLGRARRRAVSRRALGTRRVRATPVALVQAWAALDPAVAGGPSLDPAVAGGPSLDPAVAGGPALDPAVAGGPALDRSPGAASAIPPLAVRPLPLGDVPSPDERVPAGRLRRCAFRRLDIVEPGRRWTGGTYEVMCLYGAASEPSSLGDLTSAAFACAACTYTGIFRPDEA
jgi:hypothetical protein